MPKKSKINIRRSDELLAIDQELDRALEHLDEVNKGVRDFLGTAEPEPEEDGGNPPQNAEKPNGQDAGSAPLSGA